VSIFGKIDSVSNTWCCVFLTRCLSYHFHKHGCCLVVSQWMQAFHAINCHAQGSVVILSRYTNFTVSICSMWCGPYFQPTQNINLDSIQSSNLAVFCLLCHNVVHVLRKHEVLLTRRNIPGIVLYCIHWILYYRQLYCIIKSYCSVNKICRTAGFASQYISTKSADKVLLTV
jgi:hypothetical protein